MSSESKKILAEKDGGGSIERLELTWWLIQLRVALMSLWSLIKLIRDNNQVNCINNNPIGDCSAGPLSQLNAGPGNGPLRYSLLDPYGGGGA